MDKVFKNPCWISFENFKNTAIYKHSNAILKFCPIEQLSKHTLYAKVNGKRPIGRLRTRWLDYIKDLGWNSLGLRPSGMQSVLVD